MLAALLCCLPSCLLPQQAPGDDASVPVAHYQLLGRQSAVTRGDVALEMAFYLRRQDDGRAACAQLVKTALVRAAAARQGVWPEPATVRARWDEVQQQLRAVGRDPAREPIFRNCSEQALLDYLAIDLAHELIVRKELALGGGEQVSPAMLDLWVKEARQRATVVDDPDRLPIGIAVRVDDREVPMLELGMLLLRSSDAADQERFVAKLAVLQTVEAMAAERKLTVTDDELQRELTLRRALAQTDPRFRGLSFEQLLKTQGLTVDWLLQSRVFRGQVLQKKLVAAMHPRAELADELARDRPAVLARYGPRRHLAVVFLRALAEPNALVPRDFATALRDLEAVRLRLQTEPFDKVARIESDDPVTKARGGDCGWLARVDPAQPEPVRAAAWTLAAGAVSPPVRTDDGYCLVKVLEIEPDLSDDAVIERMREHRIEQLTTEILKQARLCHADGTPFPGSDAAPTTGAPR